VEIYLTSVGETDVDDMGQENKRTFLKLSINLMDDNEDSMYKFSYVPTLNGINIVCFEDLIKLIIHS